MNDLASFRALGVSEHAIKALTVKGFSEPTPIQALTIPRLLSGERDMIGQAQTGTGKTAAFGIPILDRITSGNRYPKALVLAPTRELSIQIADELNSLRGGRGIRIIPVFGGQSVGIQLHRLKDGADVIVGTPGRIIDLAERGALSFEDLEFAVLDEADEMLDMGFVEDIEKILASTPEEKQTLMFSATMPPEIRSIAKRFLRNPEIVRAEKTTAAVELAEQICYDVRREDKFDALRRLIDLDDAMYAMVFCRTRSDVDELAGNLKKAGYPAEALHGEIPQPQRLKVINAFKQKQFRLLIATDVAARGIDVNDLTHVINYSIPLNSEIYIHRVGRTGRAGNKGLAVTFVTPSEKRRLAQIRQEAHNAIRRCDLPGGKEIVEAKKQRFSAELANVLAEPCDGGCLNFARELLSLADSPEELVAAMLQMKFRDTLQPEQYPAIGAKPEPKTGRKARSSEMVRLFVGVGKGDGVGAVKLLELIFQLTGIRSYRLGKVECFDHFSFVNADEESAERILEAFRRKGPFAEIAKPDPKKEGAAEPETDSPAEDAPPKRRTRKSADLPDDNAPKRRTRKSADLPDDNAPKRRTRKPVNPDAIPAPAKKGRRWSWDDFPAENAPAPKRKRAKK